MVGMFEFMKDGFKSLSDDDLDFDFDFPLFITLTIGIGTIFLLLLVLTIYFTIFNNNQSIFLGSNFNVPGEFDDEQGLINDEEEYLPKFNQFDKKAYLQGKQFQERFPPSIKPLGTTLTESEQQFVTDRGIQAYQFIQPLEYGTSGQPAILVEDKLDVKFLSIHEANSTILNYPLPLKTASPNDTVYFEVKFFEKPEESLISVGLISKPYPLFRLPGYNKYSIAYESNGTIRVNQPFYSPSIWAKVKEGDVVGVGFKCKTGTIFFTHNGKKVSEVIHNVKFDLYPAIGSIGEAKVSANLGQIGFVFIEANVKKWGFGSTFGTIGVPPAYGNDISNDKVLDKGEELPPTYPQEEETFFGPSALLQGTPSNTAEVATGEEIQGNKPTIVISKPPSYTDEPKPELSKSDEEFNKVSNEDHERIYERQSSAFDQQNNEFDDVGRSSADLNLKRIVEALEPEVQENFTAAPVVAVDPVVAVPELIENSPAPEPEVQENFTAASVVAVDPVVVVSELIENSPVGVDEIPPYIIEQPAVIPESQPTTSQFNDNQELETTTNSEETNQDESSSQSPTPSPEDQQEDQNPQSTTSNASSGKSKGKKKNNKKKKKKGKTSF